MIRPELHQYLSNPFQPTDFRPLTKTRVFDHPIGMANIFPAKKPEYIRPLPRPGIPETHPKDIETIGLPVQKTRFVVKKP